MTSRGLSLSKKQFCDIRGWTSSEFDKAVRGGMPIVDRPTGRGTDWVVFMGDTIEWEKEQALRAAGHGASEAVKLDLNAERARLAKEQADKTELPTDPYGWREAFRRARPVEARLAAERAKAVEERSRPRLRELDLRS
jgi:phage terminase Nu1 subunit (DNA packaging protein)